MKKFISLVLALLLLVGVLPMVAFADNISEMEDGYYIEGCINEKNCSYYNVTADLKLTEIGNTGEYRIDLTFAKWDYFSIFSIKNGELDRFYFYNDDVADYDISDSEIGENIVFFRPEGYGDGIYFKVVPPICTISFNMNGHGEQIDNQFVEPGGKIQKPTDPIEEGLEFRGWYKDADCTKKWDFDTDTVSGHTTLYAMWPTPCTVTLNLGLLGLANRQLTVYKGDKITFPEDLRILLKYRSWANWNIDTDIVTDDVTLDLLPERLADGYYLFGTLGGRNFNDLIYLTNSMRLTESETTGEYKIDWTFAEGDKVMVAKVVYGYIPEKYGYDVFGYGYEDVALYNIGADEIGEKTLYFNPEGNSNGNYFWFMGNSDTETVGEGTASTISEGNIWIIAGIGVVAIGAIVVIAKKKKKVTE